MQDLVGMVMLASAVGVGLCGWNQRNTLLNNPPYNEFSEVLFLISVMIIAGSCKGCSQAPQDVSEIESNENK